MNSNEYITIDGQKEFDMIVQQTETTAGSLSYSPMKHDDM